MQICLASPQGKRPMERERGRETKSDEVLHKSRQRHLQRDSSVTRNRRDWNSLFLSPTPKAPVQLTHFQSSFLFALLSLVLCLSPTMREPQIRREESRTRLSSVPSLSLCAFSAYLRDLVPNAFDVVMRDLLLHCIYTTETQKETERRKWRENLRPFLLSEEESADASVPNSLPLPSAAFLQTSLEKLLKKP